MEEEKFLEFQSPSCLLKGFRTGREMDVVKGELQRDQIPGLHYVFRQGFPHLGKHCVQGCCLEPCHYFCGDSRILQFFRAGIDSGQALRNVLPLCVCGRDRIDFRMHKVDFPVEFRRFPEEDELFADFQFLGDPFESLEEHCLNPPCAVIKDDTQAFFSD